MRFKNLLIVAAGCWLVCMPLLAPGIFPGNCQAAEASGSTNSLANQYLKEARAYRKASRFELARQSYVQALSVCHDPKQYETIKQELNGIEMLLRTMR